MAVAADFRRFAFDLQRVDKSGKSLARDSYWRLYAAENLLRVLVHTVLESQLGPDWWLLATPKHMQDDAEDARKRYLAHPWHGTAGTHPIYFCYLSSLAKILEANKNLFDPVVKDIDGWIARTEQIVLPRNVVGHMNWLSATDKNRIQVFHSDVHALLKKLAENGLQLLIPA